jgi:hypothetical protein
MRAISIHEYGGPQVEVSGIRDGSASAATLGQSSVEEAAKREALAIGVIAQTEVGQLDQIAKLIDEGKVRVSASQVFALADASKAHSVLEGGTAAGKDRPEGDMSRELGAQDQEEKRAIDDEIGANDDLPSLGLWATRF